jgi:hypothetical protein
MANYLAEQDEYQQAQQVQELKLCVQVLMTDPTVAPASFASCFQVSFSASNFDEIRWIPHLTKSRRMLRLGHWPRAMAEFEFV